MSVLRTRTLRGESQFQRLFEKGRKLHYKGITVIVSASEPGGIAVCVSRTRHAVDRNRRKRIVRAALSPIVQRLRGGVSVALFADARFETLKLQDRTKLLEEAMTRAQVLA